VCQNVRSLFGSLIQLTSHIFRLAGKIFLSMKFVNLVANSVVKIYIIKRFVEQFTQKALRCVVLVTVVLDLVLDSC